jgi:hypothetical protein
VPNYKRVLVRVEGCKCCPEGLSYSLELARRALGRRASGRNSISVGWASEVFLQGGLPFDMHASCRTHSATAFSRCLHYCPAPTLAGVVPVGRLASAAESGPEGGAGRGSCVNLHPVRAVAVSLDYSLEIGRAQIMSGSFAETFGVVLPHLTNRGAYACWSNFPQPSRHLTVFDFTDKNFGSSL